MVAVDQGVTAPTAYVLSNDQENYGYLGAKWLFDKLGGKGNIIYMRGIEGVPADTDRDKGFKRALTEYPNIKVAKETFTGWDITKGAQQIQDIFSAGTQFDGVWTSGIDASVIDAFKTAKQQFMPIVGADNNAFVALPRQREGQRPCRRRRHQPAAGGRRGRRAGAEGAQRPGADRPRREAHAGGVGQHDGRGAADDEGRLRQDARSVLRGQLPIPDWTTYDKAQLVACKGPGE